MKIINLCTNTTFFIIGRIHRRNRHELNLNANSIKFSKFRDSTGGMHSADVRVLELKLYRGADVRTRTGKNDESRVACLLESTIAALTCNVVGRLKVNTSSVVDTLTTFFYPFW